MAAEFGEGAVEVEVVTLKEEAGAARYRDLRREVGEHLPVPSVIVEGKLYSGSIPEPDDLRAYLAAELGVPVPRGEEGE